MKAASLVAMLMVVVVGCGFSPSSPQLTKSQFYTQCSDWATVLDSSVPGREVVVEKTMPQGSLEGSGGHGRLHHFCNFACDVRCSQDGIGKFMQSLRAALRKMAQQTGAEIDEEVEGKAIEGYLGGFEIEYTAGRAHGKVTANVTGGKPGSDKPDVKIYSVVTKIEEWVR